MIFWIDGDDTEIEFVADASDFVHVLDWLGGEFGNVSETMDIWVEFDEETEWIDLEHAALDHLVHFEAFANGLPSVSYTHLTLPTNREV